MGNLKFIMIHCTATPEGREIDAEDIRRMHTDPKSEGGRGWKQVGYTHLIQLDGTIVQLVPNNGDDIVDAFEVTNGARGFNNITLHIVYAGGCAAKKPTGFKHYPPKDTRTKEQLDVMKDLAKALLAQHPKAKIIGHNQVANKACPSFDVPKWALSIGINKLRIHQ